MRLIDKYVRGTSMAYMIYWIHDMSHSDPYTQGYIGVTNNLVRRMSHHKKHGENPIVKNKLPSSVITILKSDLAREEALLIEEQYRPDNNIGWNINKGGFMPPSQKGRTYTTQKLLGESRTEKQKEASRLHSERSKHIMNNLPKVTCPHCNKTGQERAMRRWHFDRCKHKV